MFRERVLRKYSLVFACSLLLGSILFPHVEFSLAQEPELDVSEIAVSERAPYVEWPRFWQKFKRLAKWRLEYLNETWSDKTYLLRIIREFPLVNTLKVTLNFTTEEAGAYRLTFAFNKVVLNYVEKASKFCYLLNYSRFNMVFNWSDLSNYPNLIFKHGVRDNFFWFRIRHNNIPANYSVSLDPSTIVDQESGVATRYEGQHKVFRNPRNTTNAYAFFYYKNESDSDYELRFYNSTDGSMWNNQAMIHNYTSDTYESADSFLYNTGSDLTIYFAYTDSGGSLYYRNCSLSDSGSLTLGTEQTLITGSSSDKALYPQISLAQDNYVHITYERLGGFDPAGYGYVTGFDQDQVAWTEQGATPYLDAVGDNNYIYTSSNGAVERYFDFADMIRGEAVIYLELFCEGDGDDYVRCWITSIAQIVDITPPTSYDWVSVKLGEYTKSTVDPATLSLTYYKTKGGANLYVDCARLAFYSTYSVGLISSTVTFSPNATEWSSEYQVQGGLSTDELYPKSAPLYLSYDLLCVFKHKWYSAIGNPQIGLGGVELNWNGSVHSKGYNHTKYLLGAIYNNHVCLVVDPDTNEGYFAVKKSGTALKRYVWSVGSGISAETASITTHGFYYALSIDTVSSTHVHYAFAISSTAPQNQFIVRRKRLSGEFGSTAWFTEATVTDNSEDIQFFSSYWENVERGLVLIYTRETSGAVRFYAYSLEYRFNITFYFTSGGSLLINNTINQQKTPANGSTYNYGENQIVNITGVPEDRFLFLNFTYDSSNTTDNPFYLLASQDYTVWAYFERSVIVPVLFIGLVFVGGLSGFVFLLYYRRKN